MVDVTTADTLSAAAGAMVTTVTNIGADFYDASQIPAMTALTDADKVFAEAFPPTLLDGSRPFVHIIFRTETSARINPMTNARPNLDTISVYSPPVKTITPAKALEAYESVYDNIMNLALDTLSIQDAADLKSFLDDWLTTQEDAVAALGSTPPTPMGISAAFAQIAADSEQYGLSISSISPILNQALVTSLPDSRVDIFESLNTALDAFDVDTIIDLGNQNLLSVDDLKIGKEEYSTFEIRHTDSGSESVALPMPPSLSIDTTANWRQQDLGVAASLVGDQSGKLTNELQQNLKGFASKVMGHAAGKAINEAAGLVTGLVAGEGESDTTGLWAYATGNMINPQPVQQFGGMGVRTLNLEYEFSPQNNDEVISIKKIISAFRRHAHPAPLDQTKMFIRFPSVVEVIFYNSAGEPYPGIPRLMRCVINAVKVEYSSTPGRWVAFSGDGKYPTHVKLSLSFTEAQAIVRTDVEGGM